MADWLLPWAPLVYMAPAFMAMAVAWLSESEIGRRCLWQVLQDFKAVVLPETCAYLVTLIASICFSLYNGIGVADAVELGVITLVCTVAVFGFGHFIRAIVVTLRLARRNRARCAKEFTDLERSAELIDSNFPLQLLSVRTRDVQCFIGANKSFQWRWYRRRRPSSQLKPPPHNSKSSDSEKALYRAGLQAIVQERFADTKQVYESKPPALFPWQ